jgi:hypothetical protein
MHVEIRNDADVPLRFVGREMSSGTWTPGWEVPNPILPGAVGTFAAEGEAVLDAPSTGAEGRIRYQVGDDAGAELYVHFDSPLVESQYGNTFHVHAPQGFEAAWTGGQGHSATVQVTFRATQRRGADGFDPARHGYAFTNHFGDLPVVTVGYLWNRLLREMPDDLADALRIVPVADDWLPITKASAGLCGGMAFAVMDWWNTFGVAPTNVVPPTTSDDPQFQYLRDRLLDSFDIFGRGHRILAYSNPLYPNGDEGFVQNVAGLWAGRSWLTYREEWPRIRSELEAGRLCPLVLIQTDTMDIGDNHQTVAYAYEQSAQDVVLYTYDPNEPGMETRLEFNIQDTSHAVHVSRYVDGRASSPHRILAIIKGDGYNVHTPPGGPGDDGVYGAIGLKWRQLGGAHGALGANVSPDEVVGADGGRGRRFAGGLVTHHPRAGTHVLLSDATPVLDASGGVEAGHYAVDDERLAAGDDRGHVVPMQTFPAGTPWWIWWSPQTGASSLYGAIGETWRSTGRGRGALGYPVGSDTAPGPEGLLWRRFEHGLITFLPAIGANAVWGPVAERFEAIGGLSDSVVVEGQQPCADYRGQVARFEHLPAKDPYTIWWSSATGAKLTYGAIGAEYDRLGGPTSALGFPVDEEADAAGGRRQAFEHGAIVFQDGNARVE